MIVDLITPPPSPLLMAVPAVTAVTQVEPPSVTLGDIVDSCTEEPAVMMCLHSPASAGDTFSCAAFMDCQPVPVPTSPSSPDDTTMGEVNISPPTESLHPDTLTSSASSQSHIEIPAPPSLATIMEREVIGEGPAACSEHDVNTAIDSDVPEPNIVSELGDAEGDLPSQPATMAQFTSQHSKLKSLICEHQKRLRDPKVMLSDKSAANSVLELEYLQAFNNTRFELQTKLQKQKDAIMNAPPRMRAAMRTKYPSIQPSVQASAKVNRLSGKGPYFAKWLCHLSAYLLRTGLLPENNRGKGASHKTLLNRADVLAGLRLFVTGGIPVNKGGFEGHVSGVSMFPS
jgi:hypothetical protein